MFSNVSSLRKLFLRLLKLYVSYFICSSGDDPDDISSSGTEDDADVHSFATERKGTLMLLRCVMSLLPLSWRLCSFCRITQQIVNEF